MEQQHSPKTERAIRILNKGISSYALIAALIIALGGLFQVISLVEMNIVFLRFFSSTQMLNDGLTMLIALSPLMGFLAIQYIFLWDSRRLSLLFLFIFLVIFLISGIFFGQISFETPLEIVRSISFIGIIIPLAIIALLKAFKKNQKSKLPLIITWIFLMIYLITNFISDAPNKWDGVTNRWENELANFEDVICYLEKQPYFTENYKITYINDKYIFIRFYYSSASKIRVLPFDTFFEHSDCLFDTPPENRIVE